MGWQIKQFTQELKCNPEMSILSWNMDSFWEAKDKANQQRVEDCMKGNITG